MNILLLFFASFVLLSNFVLVLYAIRTLRNVLSLVFLWQLKEYRLDRMLAHLKTRQGKKLVFGWLSLIKWLIILVDFFFFFQPGIFYKPLIFLFALSFIFLPELIYYFEGFWNIIELVKKRWRFPKFTIKSATIILLVFIFILFIRNSHLYFDSDGDYLFLFLVIVDKLLSPIIFFLVLILNIPAFLYKKWLSHKAKKMIKSRPDLMTIGITGSYGKTSTKEFLASILSSKFKVLKTQESQNTTIGVARTILQKLSDQEIFVCEMGAYKIGEIREICQICRPKIGIITGINEQHLDLFGSLKKTMEAKYELIESLPKDPSASSGQAGLAVFNGNKHSFSSNNKYCLEMAEKAKTISQIGQISQIGKDIKAVNIRVTPEKLEFEVILKNEKKKMSAHLLGKQNVENILLAISAAQALGMSLKEISVAVKKLEAPEKTMRVVSGGQGGLGESGVLVDDSFNTNPDGVLAALEYMKVYKGKKILILTPMIELGEKAVEAHQKVGELAGEVCDLIILTNKNYYEDFTRGIKKDKKEKIMIVNGKKAAEKIKAILDENGVAVFEGKEAGRILND